MYKILKITLLVCLLITTSLTVNAANEGFNSKILLTSAGQNPGVIMIKVVLDRLNKEYYYAPKITADQIKNKYSCIIISVGLSCKGISAAGMSYAEEKTRIKKLIEKITDMDTTLICIHLGGECRRDDRSNELLNLIAPNSKRMIIYQASNKDNYFSDLAQEKNIPLQITEDLSNLDQYFKNCIEDSE